MDAILKIYFLLLLLHRNARLFWLVTFWKFQHFNLVSKIFRKLFKPLPCHKSTGKMLHAICISAVAVSLRSASCGPWASCFTVKLGFTGAYIIFSYFCSSKAGLTHTHNLCFWAEIWKLSEFLSENFHFFGGKIFSLNRCVFVIMLP